MKGYLLQGVNRLGYMEFVLVDRKPKDDQFVLTFNLAKSLLGSLITNITLSQWEGYPKELRDQLKADFQDRMSKK